MHYLMQSSKQAYVVSAIIMPTLQEKKEAVRTAGCYSAERGVLCLGGILGEYSI